MMQLNISGQHVDLTEPLKAYVDTKITRLEKHFDQINNAQVILKVQKLRQIAEATLHVTGGEIHANAEHDDMYAAIDLLTDKLDRQIVKYKEKLLDRVQGAASR